MIKLLSKDENTLFATLPRRSGWKEKSVSSDEKKIIESKTHATPPFVLASICCLQLAVVVVVAAQIFTAAKITSKQDVSWFERRRVCACDWAASGQCVFTVATRFPLLNGAPRVMPLDGKTVEERRALDLSCEKSKQKSHWQATPGDEIARANARSLNFYIEVAWDTNYKMSFPTASASFSLGFFFSSVWERSGVHTVETFSLSIQNVVVQNKLSQWESFI